MATKARLHWFWRGMLASIVELLLNGVCVYWLHYAPPAANPMILSLRYKPLLLLSAVIGFKPALVAVDTVLSGMPTLATAFGVYLLLTRRFGRHVDGQLHCRKCDYILHGLSEPRCPECGEPI